MKKGSVLLGILLFVTLLGSACIAKQAKSGDTVSVDYTLTLDDGSVNFTTHGREPIAYTLDEGGLLPGIEETLIGMRVGEFKKVTLLPEEAYGARFDDLVAEVNRNLLPEGLQPTLGQTLQMTGPDGAPLTVVVADVSETTVTIDANRPLAGRSLTFDLELLAINEQAPAGFTSQNTILLVLAVLVMSIAGISIFYLRSRSRRMLEPAG